MKSKSVATMKQTLPINISRMRKLWGFKGAEIMGSPLECKASLKAVAIGADAKKPGFTVLVCAALILVVFGAGCISQIGPLVVTTVCVFVINVMDRPLTSHIKPRQSMGTIEPAIYFDSGIPIFRFFSARLHANLGISAAICQAIKKTGFRVVAKNFTETLRWQCRIFSAHVARSFKTMMWEVRPRVFAHRGLAYFSASGG